MRPSRDNGIRPVGSRPAKGSRWPATSGRGQSKIESRAETAPARRSGATSEMEERHAEGGPPAGWARSTLGEITGKPRPKVRPQEFSHLRYIGLEHVEAHTTRLLGSVPATDVRSATGRFFSGDVMYGRLRPYLNKVFRADSEGLCSSEFIVLPKNDDVDSTFLLCRFNAADFVSFASNLNAGDRPRVDYDQISGFDVLLPPLPEQRRIVAEIEKQFTRIDKGVEALKRTLANLKRYRASILKSACEGKLVPTEAALARKEKRDHEPADVLLKRILKERRERWTGKGKYKEPGAPDISTRPERPKGWCWATLGQIGFAIGGLTKNQRRAKLPRQLPFLRVANVYANELRLDDVEQIGVADAEVEKLLLNPGDLLIVEGNGSKTQIGRVALWEGAIDPCVHQNHIIKVRLVDVETAKWILHWLLSPGGRTFIELVASSTSGLYTLSVNKVGALPIPIPPLAEQRRIVAEVERLLSEAEKQEQAAEEGLRRADRLRQAVLRDAFAGKLVPQDPADEPAEKLLARIRQERHSEGNSRRKEAGLRQRSFHAHG